MAVSKIKEIDSRSLQQPAPETPNPKGGTGAPPMPVVKPKTIRTVPVTMRTLTENRTYTMKSKDDVDRFIEEMREKLYEKLTEDTVVKLS